jgi:hypothetical protein
MKNCFTKIALSICILGTSLPSFAGNKDRSGQAGATELMINPWGQSTGLFGMNASCVKGLEAMKTNIAGLAFVENSEIGLSRSNYLAGAGVNINNLGIAQKVGELGAIGLNIMSVGFGEIVITDVDHPEGGIGTYSPQFLNIQAGYARQFAKGVYAGVGATFVSEQISNIHASGGVFEAGVQYISGYKDRFHFGVTLRNVGTNMRFSGNGFSVNVQEPTNGLYQMSMQFPTEKFEMPTYLNFGASYDFFPGEQFGDEKSKPKHRLTVMGNFTSNSFNNDYLGGGIEYAFKETFMLRTAYRYEKGIGNYDTRSTFYTGLATGFTIQTALGNKGPLLALDYSFRPTSYPNNGVHVFSIRLITRNKAVDEDDKE